MVDFQDPKNLERYLKTAAELECTAYRLKKSIDAANEKLMPLYEKDPARYILKPQVIEVEAPKPPSNPFFPEDETKIRKELYKYGGGGIGWCVLGVIALFYVSSSPALASIFAIISFCIALLLFKEAKSLSPSTRQKERKRIQEEYEKSLMQYKEALPRYEEEKAARQADYEKELEEYNEKVKEAKKLHREKIDAVYNSSISRMKKSLGEVEKTLRALYSMDVVHPKYRDMLAMCSIYEYFETGRCTSLKGADGAYNLYEAELRQNLIIARLDTIIDKLDEIKNNQYMLYCELKETNSILRSISSEVASIARAADLIAQTSTITAVCAQATAKNTKALKYIALVS